MAEQQPDDATPADSANGSGGGATSSAGRHAVPDASSSNGSSSGGTASEGSASGATASEGSVSSATASGGSASEGSASGGTASDESSAAGYSAGSPADDADTQRVARPTSGEASTAYSASSPADDAATQRVSAQTPGGGPGDAPTVDHGPAPTRAMASGSSGGAQEAPTAVRSRPATGGASLSRSSVDIGGAVRRFAGVAAAVLKMIGFLCAAVLIVFILLTVVGVNPQNLVAQTVGAVADVLVLDFRDLFLLPDPTLALVVNYGLAAVCWMIAGTVAARLVRGIARLVP